MKAKDMEAANKYAI